jgi:alpha-L-fucosidase 2
MKETTMDKWSNKQLLPAILFLILGLCFACQPKNVSEDLVIWYDKPAGDWYQALPIGNGTLGAMVYGGIYNETLQLNENTLYSGEPGMRRADIDVTKSYNEVRELVKSGRSLEAEKIIGAEWLGRAQDCYQPFGHLRIQLQHSDSATNYRRALDLNTAICKTSYTVNDVDYLREVFASHPDQVIVINLDASKKQTISCKIRLEGAHPTANTMIENNVLVMKGQAPALALRRPIDRIKEWKQEWMYPELFDENGDVIPGRSNIMYGDILDKGTYYEGRVAVELQDGSLSIQGDQLVIENASKVKIVLSGDTSFNGIDKSPSKEGVDPSLKAKADLHNAVDKTFDELKKDHVNDYQSLFKRVRFSLGAISEQGQLPTDQRLENFTLGNDHTFTALFMQYARYLTIASSREGGQPINLQGMWNEDIIPPWAGAYTLNINAEIYYWMTEAANLSECTEPLLRMVKDLSVDGSRHAREAFGFDGWTAHHNTAIWRGAEPVDYYNCSFWPFSAAWLCQHIITHYNYTKDTDFLRSYWPTMKGAAKFLSEWLVVNADGFYTTPVGSSPENRFYMEGTKQSTAFCEGPAMDLMLAKELFTNCIKVAQLLNENDSFIARIKNQRDSLQEYKIGSQGQLLEWDKEYEEVDPEHRHISHVYAFCPGNEITNETSPELVDAVRRSLEIRGDEGTGWSMAWKACCWARLKDGNHAYRVLNNLFVPGGRQKAGLIPNLLASCPPFNIDGNFGAGAAIIEMLLQSHETTFVNDEELPIIELHPALPDVWPAGEITGLRAVNGFEVDLKWKEGQITKATIHSLLGEKAIIRYQGKDYELDLPKGESFDFGT